MYLFKNILITLINLLIISFIDSQTQFEQIVVLIGQNNKLDFWNETQNCKHSQFFLKMMQDVESYGIISKDRKEVMLKDRIIAYIAILLTLTSFILSCVGLNMGRQVPLFCSPYIQTNLEKTLYTFSFPYFNQVPEVKPGVVVSLDNKGYIFTGAGTTISRNVTVTSDIDDFYDIRVSSFTENVIITGTKGKLTAFEISYDDISLDHSKFDLPRVGNKDRNVEGLYKLSADTLAVVGSGQILPITIKVTEKSAIHYDISFKAGQPYVLSKNADSAFAHCDDLRDDRRQDMLACTWEEGDNLMTGVFRLNGEGESKSFMKVGEPFVYGLRRKYHGLAGLGPEGYVVAAAGRLFNETEEYGPIELAYVHVHNDKIFMGNFTRLPHTFSGGFFALDNMYMNGAVICYQRVVSGGINCMGIDVTYGPQGGGLQFGSTLVVSKGGAATDHSRTKLQYINWTTFAIMWPDQNVGGAITYQLVSFNDAGDMSKRGPAYVVSHRNRDMNVLKHRVGCTYVDMYKSAIVELVQTDTKKYALLHTVYVYPRPIGVASKNLAGRNQVQFGGLWKVSKEFLKKQRGGKLVPGTMYYTNDRGMILRGFPAGYAHRSFGIFYIVSRDDDSILNLHNQVGMAISETEILLRFH